VHSTFYPGCRALKPAALQVSWSDRDVRLFDYAIEVAHAGRIRDIIQLLDVRDPGMPHYWGPSFSPDVCLSGLAGGPAPRRHCPMQV